jgi:hypothetical protein
MGDSSSPPSVVFEKPLPRRWVQFNLKTLLAAVTAVAILLGWLGYDRGWWRPRASRLASQAVLDAARRGYAEARANYDAGVMTFEQVCVWSQRWMEAERAVAENRDAEVSAVVAQLQRIDQLRQRARTNDAPTAAYYFAAARALLEQLQPNVNVEASLAIMRSLQGTWDVDFINPLNSLSSLGDLKSAEIRGERIWFHSHNRGASWAFLTIDTSVSPMAFHASGFNDDYSVSYDGTLALDGDELTIEVTSEPKPIRVELMRQSPASTRATSGTIR